MDTDVSDNKQKIDRPWLFKKGQSGNLAGRPVGSKTLKTRVKEYLMSLSDEEFDEYLGGLDKMDIWKMAEGNPESKTDITSAGKPIPIYGGQSTKVQGHDSNKESVPTEEKN